MQIAILFLLLAAAVGGAPARVELGLKGCFDSGKSCRCLGSDNRFVVIDREKCRKFASELQAIEQPTRTTDRSSAPTDAKERLRAEQARFAALTAQAVASPRRARTTSSRYQSPSQRCADAKAKRDSAYKKVGINRNFDFSRKWDDTVYEACKNT